MTVEPLSVAIIGCGMIGANHARAIASVEGLRVDALVDNTLEVAIRLADCIEVELEQPRPAQYDSMAALPPSIAIVVICTPSGMHVELAERALATGRHVVLEKPLDVSMTRGRRLAALAESAARRGQIVSIISQHRFDPGAIVVAEAAHTGRFGRLTGAVASVAWWRSQAYYDSGAWRGTWSLDGGGAAMNQGVHTVDLLVWFLGRPIEVYAQTAVLAHERIEVEDVAAVTIRFESGALAVLHATTAAFPGISARIQVHGDQGSAVLDNDQLGWFFSDGGSADRGAELVPEGFRVGDPEPEHSFVEGHARQYHDIYSAIVHRHTPKVGVPEALLSLAVVRAIYVSATRGTPVLVEDLLSGAVSDAEVRTGGRVIA